MEKSSVLDRVKMFLPEIKKANEELFEKINREGHESIIVDSNLAPSSADDQQDISEVDSDSEAAKNGKSNEEGKDEDKKIMIKLEFALGDFDNSAIALAEEEEDEDEKDK